MADALTSQVIQDGPRNAILKFTNVSDGTGQSLAVLVDVSTLSADLLTDWSDQLDFSDFGIPNDAAAGKTGDILVTTSAATAGDTYTLVLTLTKSYVSV